ncbi:MAG: hypothetical protein II399_00055, partial [Lachnospiraceae bacterium]|nr:hypothetical protein [Lachnospiraceae bacterium]
EFAASTGGIFIENPEEVFKYSPEFVKARFNLWIPLLIIAALLFLYDIAVRRFHLSFAFVDKMAANRAKNKLKREEKKRKEEAEVIKAETAEEKEEEKSGIIAAASQKPSEKPQSAPKGKIRQYVNENPQSAYKAPAGTPAATPAKPAGSAAAKQQTAQTATGTAKETPSFSSLKKPGVAGTATQTNTQSRVFERKDAAPIYFKDNNAATKKPDAGKTANKSNDSVTSAALKTRVWIRDDD